MKSVLRYVQLWAIFLTMQTSFALAQSDASRMTEIKTSQWILSSIGSIKKIDISVPLTIDGDSAYGTDGCNRFSASIQWGGPNELKFKSGNAAMTMMACWGEAESISQVFRKVLSDTRSFAVIGEGLLLKNEQGDVLATYTKQDKSIAATRWQMLGLNNGQQGVYSDLAVSKLSIAFGADGIWVIAVGCESLSGRYQLGPSAGAVVLSLDPVVKSKCVNSSALKTAKMYLMTAIKKIASYRREGSNLELRSRDGALQISANLQK